MIHHDNNKIGVFKKFVKIMILIWYNILFKIRIEDDVEASDRVVVISLEPE